MFLRVKFMGITDSIYNNTCLTQSHYSITKPRIPAEK